MEAEEVTFDELQDKYNLMYNKWIELAEINKMLSKDLQYVQKQKESLEQRNYELMAQVKRCNQKTKLS